ncbi:BamA/TamA family outer membrane protein [Hymenobacter canadensis]|uniref:BamA/TamA family outer membrane protein n=1 Tax=Hymenobacter canadensis TaxID=2999067 RepID=A0ABY7LX32_9BACT|nr:BamA/TamA family outer membrane protein [Hymenobacter canadensis]WBA44086.1 BamA/TamA family outer membrane protein [Hymenobacter canadensis]
MNVFMGALRAALLAAASTLTSFAAAAQQIPVDSLRGRTAGGQIAQTDTSRSFLDRVLDVFEFDLNRSAVAQGGAYPTRLVLAPIISYAPETSWGAGVGAKFLFKPKGAGTDTRTSNIPVSFQYTLNNQFILYSGYTVFFNHENYLLRGNLLHSSFPQLFYGVGNNTPESNEEIYDYRYTVIEPLLLRRLTGKLFVGGGLRHVRVSDVQLAPQSLLLDETGQPRAAGALGAVSTGLESALTYDTRDNVLNAQRGVLAEITHGWYGEQLGGQFRYELTKIDLRQYFQLGATRPHVLAYQVFGYLSSGNVPLLEQGALGGNELMRGYYEGRYLDRNYAAAQVEYRRPLTTRLGVVGFVSAGKVAPRLHDFNFRDVHPAAGAGLRFKLVKAENLNLRLDAAFGDSGGTFYLNVAEAF